MGVGCVDGEAKCFEGGGGVVIRESLFELFSHVVSGGVGDSFVEVNDLPGESVEGGALFVGFLEAGSSGS